MRSFRDEKEYAFDLELYSEVIPEVRSYGSLTLYPLPHIFTSRGLKRL